MADKLSKLELEELVGELICSMETMDADEYEEKKNSLPPKYQRQLEEAALEFADNAVGHESWRSDW
jgi:hypothetical protein